MNWIILIIAGLFEVAFASVYQKRKKQPGTRCICGMQASLLRVSMGLLVRVTQFLPIGTAYAVWRGIGAVGTVLLGILVLREPASFLRLFFLTTLIGSLIGLKAVSH